MPKCQFCSQEGVHAPAPVHGPPLDPPGGVGLKLVTCDFHLHHCAFFMCAACWNAERNLCKQEHPLWESRIVGWAPPSGAREVAKRDKWRFRYTAADGGSYPSMCTRGGLGASFCSSCGTQGNVSAVGSACSTMGCAGLFREGFCPACIRLNLPSHDGVVQDCRAPKDTTPPVDLGQVFARAATPQSVPDDLAPYRKLDIHYSDTKDYGLTSVGPFDTGARRFRVRPGRPAFSTYATAPPGDVVQDSSSWPEYVATDLRLVTKEFPFGIDGVVVLLPAASMSGGKAGNPRHVVRSAPSTGIRTRGQVVMSDPTDSVFADAFGGALLLRKKTAEVFSIPESLLRCLDNERETVMPAPVILRLPPRGGGSGGALGRADGIGTTGIKHAVLSRHAKAPDVTWGGFSKFVASARTTRKGEVPAGAIEDVITAPLAVGTSYLPLRTLAQSSLSLHASVPAVARTRPAGNRAQELFVDRLQNLGSRALALAAEIATRLIARLDDGGGTGRTLSRDTMLPWLRDRLPQFETNLADAETLERETIDLLKMGGGDEARAVAIRGGMHRYLTLCRAAVADTTSDDELLKAFEAAIVRADLPAIRRDLAVVKQHHADFEAQRRKRELGPSALSPEDARILEVIRERFDLKGDPDDEEVYDSFAAYKAWWGELWVPAGLDEADDDAEIPEPGPEAFDVSAEDENDTAMGLGDDEHPAAWPREPPVDSEYWYWNGRPLKVGRSLDDTWRRLTAESLERREYKDSHLFVMRPPTDSRKDADRDQDTFFDGISATEVASGVSNRVAAQTFRFGSLAPETDVRKPTASFEWSHLVGDGEGGGIHRSNVVSSTRANNTEMLVLETVLQNAHETCRKHGLDIVLRVESSLVPRLPELERDETLFGGIRFTHYLSHAGDWMRYRVWLRPNDRFQRPATNPAPPCPEEFLVLDHVMDCLRMRISKATVRLLDYQARFLMMHALRFQYGVNWGDAESMAQPTLGWDGGEGVLELRPYVESATAFTVGGGRRLSVVPNAGGGDCLYHAIRDALGFLDDGARATALGRAGLHVVPDALALRRLSVAHLRRILGYGGPHPAFHGNADQFGPAADPRAGTAAFTEFLNTYREDYDRAWPFHGYSDWDTYLAGMDQAGTWGDMIICTVLSHLFGVQIDVHRAGGAVQPVLSNDVGAPPVLRIYNPNGVHFEAMREVPLVA